MTNNEQRAHDIALTHMQAIFNHYVCDENAKGPIDLVKEYMDIYNEFLETFTTTFIYGND